MIKTVIVEDEVAGQELIRHYLKKHGPQFEVVAVIDNVTEAIHYLSSHEVDLVMLDIHIKQGTGFDVLSRLDKREFETIFITAFDQYAIQAIRHQAFDYILKPVVEAEFISAIQRVMERINAIKPRQQDSTHIVITRSGRIERIDLNEIIFFEADGAYTYIQTTKERIYTSKNLGEYVSMVPNHLFVRSHHSYLVNIDHVLSIEKKRSGILALTNGFRVPVSQRKVVEFVQFFKNRER